MVQFFPTIIPVPFASCYGDESPSLFFRLAISPDSEKNINLDNYEKMTLNDETLYVDRNIVFNDTFIEYAEAYISGFSSPEKDIIEISIKFNLEGTRILEQLTKNNKGKRLAIVYGDEILTAPLMKVPITEGEVVLVGDFTKKEAEQFIGRMKE